MKNSVLLIDTRTQVSSSCSESITLLASLIYSHSLIVFRCKFFDSIKKLGKTQQRQFVRQTFCHLGLYKPLGNHLPHGIQCTHGRSSPWSRRSGHTVEQYFVCLGWHLKSANYTVWKFQNFAITQISREMNFGDFTSAKSAILTHLEALNFDIYEIWHFLKAEIYQINKIWGV